MNERRFTEDDMRRQFDAGRDFEYREGRNPDPDSAAPPSPAAGERITDDVWERLANCTHNPEGFCKPCLGRAIAATFRRSPSEEMAFAKFDTEGDAGEFARWVPHLGRLEREPFVNEGMWQVSFWLRRSGTTE